MVQTYLLQFPWTISFFILFILTNLGAFAPTGKIKEQVLKRFGLANAHIYTGSWLRLVSSIFFTHTRYIFWWTLLVTTSLNFTGELIFGSKITLVVFFSSHVVASLATAKVTWVGKFLFHHREPTMLHGTTDVGPSGGYYGLAGFAVVLLSPQYQGVFILSVLSFLLGDLARLVYIKKERGYEKILAVVVHIIAFVFGYGLTFILL